ncbi:MAG: phosphoribosyltransferase [Fimbriimonas sp.]
MDTRFRDRADAGRRLAARLAHLRSEDPVVFGLARGGVVVAAEVAQAVGAELDVLVVRKVGAPHNPEFGIGAVAPGGARSFDAASVATLALDRDVLDRLAQAEEVEVNRRLAAYRHGRPEPSLTGRTVLLVDDGLATGVTAEAAAVYLRSQGAARIVMAAPICSPSAARRIRAVVDEVVCLCSPEAFRSVGQWYENFDQTSDAEVQALLGASGGRYLA